MVSHNNDGIFYEIAIDSAKEGSEVWDLNPYFKARVGDSNAALGVRWYNQGLLATFDGKQTPIISGNVGSYSIDAKTKELIMSPDAAVVNYTGTPNDMLPGGRAKYVFPEQMFPKEGAFKGFIGYVDESDGKRRVSGVTVWFKVLPGVAQMGRACDFYVDILDKTIANFKEKIRQQSIDFDAALQLELKKEKDLIQQKLDAAGDAMDEDTAALKKLATAVGAIQGQIDAGNVITRKEYNDLANKIENTLAKMNFKPETFENEAALRAKYPNGVENELKVTADTGHKWLYVNRDWKDCGVFQSAGYPEVDEARIGAKHLGAKEYASLSEAIHRQVDGLSNLGNQAFSYPITGIAGQQVSLQSEYEVGLQAGATLKVKFDLAGESDLSIIQVYANGAWFTSIEAKNFGKWLRFKLDNDVNTLGLVVPADKFSKNFNGNISFQVITVPVAEMQKKLEQLSLYEVPVSLSTSKDELMPEYIDNISFDKGNVIYVRLKADHDGIVKNYQLMANGKFLKSFNDVNIWHEVVLTDDTTSFGFQAYKESVMQNADCTFQIVGSGLADVYQEFDKKYDEINNRLSELINLNLDIIASSNSDDINFTAVKNIKLLKGAKLKVQFASTADSSSVEGYQIYANGKFLISFQDMNTWHEITLPEDTVSLGYAFYKKRIHGDVTGTLQFLGGSLNNLYDIITSETERKLDGQLTSTEVTQLKAKEKQINDINGKITHGISFIFMTDPHFPDNDILSKPSMKHVLDHTSIPFVICGGDYPGAFGSKDDALAARDEVLDYQNYIGKGKFFSVQGNHDFTIRKSQTDSTGYTAENSLVYDALVRPNEFYLSSVQAGKEYYYIDIPSQSTRIFMLNSMDENPATENTDAWGTQYTISQDQADWLVTKAKEKAGWKFIFVCHVPCDSNLGSYHPNEEYFHKVATAINGKHKLSFHDTGINEDADFTDTTNQVVTILSGHNHVDQSSAKDGVLSITTTSDARYGDGGWDRPKEAYSSQAFDVVSINFDSETINTTRIGGGQDRIFSYATENQGEEISSLNLQAISDFKEGDTMKCVVTMTTPLVPQSTEWSNKCFAWTTSDSSIVDVDRSGKIMAHRRGTVRITVATRDGRHSDYCDVTIK